MTNGSLGYIDVGQIQNKGIIFYKGIIIFNNNATGNMKFLYDQIGLEIVTVEGSNPSSRIVKWYLYN